MGEEEKTVLGVDEAGRGCVIGPMIICGFFCSLKTGARLRRMGVRDSKELTPQRREDLDKKLRSLKAEFCLVEVHARKIDDDNLNRLTMETSVELIKQYRPARVYLDAPVTGRALKEYGGKIFSLAGQPGLEVVAKNNADKRYGVVSAASILAKVYRDAIIKNFYAEYGNFGSGYPSDPRTVSFLADWYRQNGDFPSIVRRKWGTLKKICAGTQIEMF